MAHSRTRKHFSPPYAAASVFFLLIFPALAAVTGSAKADADVYAALPEDTRVVQYGLSDLDGDSRKELAVFFTSGNTVRLALFRADAGRWSLWWEAPVPRTGLEPGSPRSMELVDTNGDGKDEILTYCLAEKAGAMITRILALNTRKQSRPTIRTLLEDLTSPPGYPLFGFEGGLPSVTFLKMPSENGSDGYRRVYCWKGDRFEKCVEVPWEKP